MSLKNSLLARIKNKEARVGIVGLGYVGLPLAVAFAEAGFQVLGVDVDVHKVKALNAGESYVEDVVEARLAPLVTSGRFRTSSDYAALADVDIISICVPTPLRKTRDPDISYIINATENINHHMYRGKLIVLESTTYPGTTEEIILPRLSANGAQVGEDFFLAFSPERIDPGRTDYTIYTTPKVIGGTTPDCTEVAVALYRHIVRDPIPVSGTATAEMVKLLENTFRAVNIALVNEMALMCDRLDLNVWEVVEAAATKPYGFMPFYPGPGLGGHCIPIDPHYLSWKLRTLNYTARFIELASEINGQMPTYVVTKVTDALNGDSKAVNGSRVLIIGAAYKPNVSDMRESPALDVIHLLQDKGADVQYHDPYVPDLSHEGIALQSVPLSSTILAGADCVVIITDHANLDWQLIQEQARLVVDTRNALEEKGSGRIIPL
jgi:UDP-N-acetyl-D-glucosamine dehydrogenase